MFLGTHTPKLDDKGRVFLPARFREELQGGLVMIKGQERCLAIYPVAGFADLTRGLHNSGFASPDKRAFVRMLTSGASQEVPDKQGRITIPPALRTYAGLDREVAVIGAMERVEVWDVAAWEAYSAAQEDAYASLPEAVVDT